MSNRVTRGAPALLASLLVGFAVTASPVRAQTAPAPTTADDCLAKPNGASPRGSHWYYHLDRANNRQCWYLRPTVANARKSETRQARISAAPATRPGVITAADPPIADTPSNPPADTGAPNIGWNVSPAAVAPAVAPPPPLPSIEREPSPMVDGAADQSAMPPLRESRTDGANPNHDSKPAKRAALGPTIERPALSVGEPTHMPALLGIGLALALIIIGSLAGRLSFKYFRRPRRRAVRDLPGSRWDVPSFHLDDSPGIVPVAPRRPDITRDTRDLHGDRAHDPDRPPPYGTRTSGRRADESRRLARPAEPTDLNSGEKASPQGREAVGVGEDHVRELLLRLRAEPQDRPPRARPSSPA